MGRLGGVGWLDGVIGWGRWGGWVDGVEWVRWGGGGVCGAGCGCRGWDGVEYQTDNSRCSSLLE